MDLITTPTTTNNHTPDTENETPPAATAPPNKSLSFTNGGAVKKHSQIHHHSRPPAVVVTYKECLKNHAASLGGHAVDGCGDFMLSLTDNPTDPTSLKCAACGCHRNFHRREDDPNTHFLDFHRHFLLLPPPPHRISPPFSSPSPSPSPSPQTPPPQQQQQPSYYSTAPQMLLALSTAGPEDQPATPTAAKAENPNGRKRFRTKFSQQQKEKMMSFSEKLGWKMQKCDEGLVEEFCNEVGVGKGVLRVWMHNNKHSFGKRDINASTTTTTTTNNNSNSNGRVLNFDNNISTTATNHRHHHHHHDNESNNGVHLHVSTNGSPSSA